MPPNAPPGDLPSAVLADLRELLHAASPITRRLLRDFANGQALDRSASQAVGALLGQVAQTLRVSFGRRRSDLPIAGLRRG